MVRIKNDITLRHIDLEDTQNILRWRNSPDVKKNLYTQKELTEEEHIWWFNHKVATGECAQFIIEISENNRSKANVSIGTVFIKNIDRQNNKGEFGIFIGERESRGKGYALQATKKILKHAFENLKLNRVYLTVFYDNVPAIKVYEKAGFEKEGLLKQDYLRYDGYCDVLCMGITFDNWKNNKVNNKEWINY